MGGVVRAITKVVTAPIKIISKALSWIAPKPPEIPDFGTTDFDDFETGILLNKQSNDANIPVIYSPFIKRNITREEYDASLANLISSIDYDLIILAGWMHVFTNKCSITPIN